MAEFNSTMMSFNDSTGMWTGKGTSGMDFSGSAGTFKTPTGAMTLNGTTTLVTGKTLVLTDADSITVGGVKVPQTLNISSASFGASQTSFTLFVADNAYQVTGVSAVFGTASSSGTLQVEVATGTEAVGSGTNQLTGTVSLAGTANTVVSGTMIASPTSIAAGNRINVILAGTLTSLANCVVTVTLKRV